MPNPPGLPLKIALFVIFICSGFSGLIYESIWSHYLKLMLGHAAYAQTLVLSIFMGGMAAGAWIASRYSRQWAKPLLVYAGVELAVGLMALGFHGVFIRVLDGLYLHWLPGLENPLAADALKWSVGALLILPQSVLLGATFPLMSAGFIRLYPAAPGAGLGLLYFANSLGAAVGVLVSVFVLIPAVGLPGTMMTAGLLNAALAIAVWALTKTRETPLLLERPTDSANAVTPLLKPLLAVALGSSMASFFYEIGWIRMLSMVLGSSVQAFELMLSAFILGLAFGGLWIRGRLDRIESPLRYAGHVQILMGVCALVSLPLYEGTFDWMAFLVDSLNRNEGGYRLFNVGSQLIAMAVMLPATFTAGMTLPLFTYALLRQGEGERSIGRVYSANTAGAIFGVLLAVHGLMPLVGVKGLISAGALVDMLVGLALLALSRPHLRRFELPLSAGVAAVLFLAVTLAVRLDPLMMSSGVYRTGGARWSSSTQSVFYRDGKTSSVALNQSTAGTRIIITNGKPDATIQMVGEYISLDEITQTMLAVLPLSLHPQAKTFAAIGFGSGMTTHTLLGAPTLARVDTIEIEPAMVEAARGFGAFVERAYTDPRSHIHIDDAKTYFSSRNARYDVIISEPSNPWVSGVASLFSEEFYQQAKAHLRPDGLLVQWLQLYETNLPLLASVFKAMNKHFSQYVVFNTSNEDIIVIASNGRDLNQLDEWIFAEPALRASLARVGVKTMADLQVRRIGGSAVLQPFFAAALAPANSDYFPYLSYNAPKARYLRDGAFELTALHHAPVPIMEMLDRPRTDAEFAAMPRSFSEFPVRQTPAAAIAEALLSGQNVNSAALQGFSFQVQSLRLELLGNGAASINDSLIQQRLFELAKVVNPYLPAPRAVAVWDWFSRQPSFGRLSSQTRDWLTLYRAVGLRDGAAMGEAASRILATPASETNEQENEYLLTAALTGYLAVGDTLKARSLLALIKQGEKPLPPQSTSRDILLWLTAYKKP
jgi:predicted membrane-bound spermidine synthase